jgi:hypothetical protein
MQRKYIKIQNNNRETAIHTGKLLRCRKNNELKQVTFTAKFLLPKFVI